MQELVPTRSKQEQLVLIIDDNPRNLQVVSKIIDQAGFRVAAAMGEDQAFSMIANAPPDLILLDIIMPGTNGLQLCRKLKQTPETADIPVIMLTVRTATEDIVRAFDAGAADYVIKPFNPEELLVRVNAQIELKEIHDQQARLIRELQRTLSEVKQLSELIPICSHCKKIRGDKGYWLQVEEYIATHSSAQIRHSTCPDCRTRNLGLA